MHARKLLIAVSLFSISLLVLDATAAWARARSGGFGGRGSRSYSAPARPSPVGPTTPASPGRSVNQPAPPSAPVMPASRPGFFGGLMGAVAGFALGGLLGGLLFGGLGHGLGIGFLDLLLIGGGVLLLVAFLRRKRAAAPAYAMAGAPGAAYGSGDEGAGPASGQSAAGAATLEASPVESDLERGLRHVRQMDPAFDPAALAEFARGAFHHVQSAWKTRDMTALGDLLARELYTELQAQCDRMRSARQCNHVERIEIRRAELTEAWQESGQDYATVYLAASCLDYTVDDMTGAVVEGSKTTPQEVEEFWTFKRPVGANRWKVSAIQPG